MHAKALQVFHEAALEIARARGFDGRVDQALASRHAVEVVLLRAQPGEEAVGNVPSAARTALVRAEAG